MRNHHIKHLATLGVLAAALAGPSAVQASLTVHSGWDLLVTVPSLTSFMGQNWQGVPIGTYDFGGSIGYRYVGVTDTIIHRPQTATVSGYGQSTTVSMGIAALQMRSVNPFDPDGSGPAPLDYYYITLAGASGGNVTINFDHQPSGPPAGDWEGWFTTSFDVNYAVHQGSLNGPIVATGTEGPFTSTPTPYWNPEKTFPGGGVPLVQGVNYLLDGTDTSQDFHLAYGPNPVPVPGLDCPYAWDQAQLAAHGITECPEPGVNALLVVAGGLLGLARFCRRNR